LPGRDGTLTTFWRYRRVPPENGPPGAFDHVLLRSLASCVPTKGPSLGPSSSRLRGLPGRRKRKCAYLDHRTPRTNIGSLFAEADSRLQSPMSAAGMAAECGQVLFIPQKRFWLATGRASLSLSLTVLHPSSVSLRMETGSCIAHRQSVPQNPAASLAGDRN